MGRGLTVGFRVFSPYSFDAKDISAPKGLVSSKDPNVASIHSIL